MSDSASRLEAARAAGREASRRRRESKAMCSACGRPVRRIGISQHWAHLPTPGKQIVDADHTARPAL